MNVRYCVLSVVLPLFANAGEIYSYSELQRMAVAFVDTYEDLIVNSSSNTDTEMLMLSSEYKGYVGAYLDASQRGQDIRQSDISQCLFDNTFEEIALNSSYLLIDMQPIDSISAVENFSLAVQAFCSGRAKRKTLPLDLTGRFN